MLELYIFFIHQYWLYNYTAEILSVNTGDSVRLDHTMLNSHTKALSARQLSSNHLPVVGESVAQLWERPPSGWWVISVSQFLKRNALPPWSSQVPSVTMSLIPSQMCSSGPMVWRAYSWSLSFCAPASGVLRTPPLAMQASFAAWKFFFVVSDKKHLPRTFIPFKQTIGWGGIERTFMMNICTPRLCLHFYNFYRLPPHLISALDDVRWMFPRIVRMQNTIV